MLLSGSYFGFLYAFPEYQPRLSDLLLAVPLGLLGALAGAIFMLAFKRLRQLLRPLNNHLIVRSLIGGLGLGTGLYIGGLMQEDVSAVDDKIRHLQGIYEGMLSNLRTLAIMPESEQLDLKLALQAAAQQQPRRQQQASRALHQGR